MLLWWLLPNTANFFLFGGLLSWIFVQLQLVLKGCMREIWNLFAYHAPGPVQTCHIDHHFTSLNGNQAQASIGGVMKIQFQYLNKWELPTEHVVCFTIVAALQGVAPKNEVVKTCIVQSFVMKALIPTELLSEHVFCLVVHIPNQKSTRAHTPCTRCILP